MATESTPPQTDAVVSNGEAAVPATTTAGEQKPQRERRQHTPPEELYDLSKPIPKVRIFGFLRANQCCTYANTTSMHRIKH